MTELICKEKSWLHHCVIDVDLSSLHFVYISHILIKIRGSEGVRRGDHGLNWDEN